MRKFLCSLLFLFFINVTWATVISSTYYSPLTTGNFYLYNITSGNFYTNGGWSPTPSVVTTITQDGSYFRIQGNSSSNYLKIGVYKGQYLWYDGITSKPIDWTFTTTSDNKFIISMDPTNVAKDVSVPVGTYYIDGTNATTTAANADEFALITQDNYNAWSASLNKIQNIPCTLDPTLATVSSSAINAGWNGTNFGYMTDKSMVNFQVSNATAQTYTLNFDAAANDAMPSVGVVILDASNNNIVSKSISINQYGWNSYITYRASIPLLTAGNYTLILTTNLTGSGYSANLKNVIISAGNSADITLDEASDSYSGNGYYENVILKRTLSSTNWNTFCVPFAMAIPSGWTVKQLSSAAKDAEGNITLAFENAASIASGQPYMVKCGSDYSGTYCTTNTTLSSSSPIVQSVNSIISFTGNYTEQYVPQGSYFISTNKFYCADNANSVNLNGFRAYLSSLILGNAKSVSFVIDGNEVTSIEGVKMKKALGKSIIYDLKGCRVSSPTKGIYIMNGKKHYFNF